MTMTDFDETNSSNYRFAVLSLEYLKWLACYAASESVPAMETNVDVCIRTAALALENPALSDAVSGLDNGLAADEDASAIELVGPKDAFDPLPEVDWLKPFHLYACCSSGGGKSTYIGRLADRFRDITGGQVICFSAEENEDDAVLSDVRMHVDRCEELTPRRSSWRCRRRHGRAGEGPGAV